MGRKLIFNNSCFLKIVFLQDTQIPVDITTKKTVANIFYQMPLHKKSYYSGSYLSYENMYAPYLSNISTEEDWGKILNTTYVDRLYKQHLKTKHLAVTFVSQPNAYGNIAKFKSDKKILGIEIISICHDTIIGRFDSVLNKLFLQPRIAWDHIDFIIHETNPEKYDIIKKYLESKEVKCISETKFC